MQAASDTIANAEASIALSPLKDAFICPSDEQAAEQSSGSLANWYYAYYGGYFLNGYSSYCVSDEVFGWYPFIGYNRLRGRIAGCANPSDTVLMFDGLRNPNTGDWEGYAPAANTSMADAYMSGDVAFDLVRHHGRMNILCADGHVESQPILSNGATVATGALGSAGNTPSGFVTGHPVFGGNGLAGISMNKNFQ